ncbi:MAG TPA: DinB family protein [Thermoanaerobaculia bacterium]|jgi:uncharacterized damage-inducible protein DinB|nr:DinB family protein [Thermoanaerobaculia bacterium]
MNASDVRSLYAYTDWANDRILAAIARLSEEQFTRQIVSSFPSIRDTLSHIASGEWIWLQRWMGESPPDLPDWAKAPSFAILDEKVHGIAADRRTYLTDLADDRIESTVHYRSTRGDPFAMPLGELLIHCANHSTYHRGQLVTMLRQVGAEPPTTDYTHFVRSRVR